MGVFSQEEHLRGMQLKQKLYLHLISRHVRSRNYLLKRFHTQLFFPTRLFDSRYSLNRSAERSSVPASDKAIAPDSQKNTPTSLSERQHKANNPPNRCHATPPRQASASQLPLFKGNVYFPHWSCPAGSARQGFCLGVNGEMN